MALIAQRIGSASCITSANVQAVRPEAPHVRCARPIKLPGTQPGMATREGLNEPWTHDFARLKTRATGSEPAVKAP